MKRYAELQQSEAAEVRIKSRTITKLDYRADWGVILMNTGSKVFTVKQGDRIAQVVWVKIERAIWEEVDSLEESERGENGFGHSGIK